MPTYQYECLDCGHSFEILQSMTDAKLRKCPQCGKFKLSRLIGTGSGVIFKGSGFYETDYKRKDTSQSTTSKESKASSKTSTNISTPCSSNCQCHPSN